MADIKVDPVQIIEDTGKIIDTVQSTSKPFWKSKTFWANVAMVGIHYVGYLPSETAVYVVPVVNILIRFLTKSPITVK